MIRGALLATLAMAAAIPLEARQVDPEGYILLITRYANACQALSPTECEFTLPLEADEAQRLACLFDELDVRVGTGTAEAHVGWAEQYAATGQPPDGGFPANIGQEQVLVAAMIACGAARQRSN